MIRRATLVAAALWFGCIGCAPRAINVPVQHAGERGYRFADLQRGAGNTDETVVVVALAGGGLRSAAFSYGVLAELASTVVGSSDLLAEVDVISAVSGGSFAAGYFGAHGREKFLREFPSDVLRRNVRRDVFLRFWDPVTGLRLLMTRFSRSDVADTYCSSMFAGRSFADIARERPFIIINATDLSSGAQFAFTQDHFDRLCSDLGSFPISRAVVASAANPILLAPVVLRNYPKPSCGYATPSWVHSAVAASTLDVRRQRQAKIWRSYEDDERDLVYLLDGRLADPRALREFEASLTSDGAAATIRELIASGTAKRIVLIAVDSTPSTAQLAADLKRFPLPVSALDAAVWRSNENAASDLWELLRQRFARWEEATANTGIWRRDARRTCGGIAAHFCRGDVVCERERTRECETKFVPPDVMTLQVPRVFLINVSPDGVRDASLQRALDRVPASFALRDDEVDVLVDAGRRLLRESAEFQRLLDSLQHTASGESVSDVYRKSE